MSKTYTVNTQSFVIVLNKNLIIQGIKITNPKLEELYKDSPEDMSKGLLQELAMNLYASKEVNEEIIDELEKLRETIENNESTAHKLKLENEMLRDELDKY